MAEVATSAAGNLVSKLGECLFAPIRRQFEYVLCYNSYVEDLQTAAKELDGARERLQHSVDEARRDVKPIYTDVQDWLGNVTKDAEEAQHLLECGKSAENACFCGWIPNPLVRHRMGRKMRETTEVIRGRLREKRRNSDFKEVSYESTPPGIVTAPTSNTRSVDKKEVALESRALIMEDVINALADDKVHVVGVWGVGGVGKSKLLADIKERVVGENLFDEVAMADVLRDPDLKNIQGEIAYALGLKLTNDEPPRVRADRLCTRLKHDPKKKILILLDNLWKKLELKDVGIPCGDENKVMGCKLLLTSRYRHVLHDDMGSDRLLELKMLKHGEARKLFESRVGSRVDDPDFAPFVDGVVKNCEGLPLWIVSSAKTLRRRDSTAWRNALTNIEGSDAIVKLNYEDLNDERIQSVFLVCALNSGFFSLRDSIVQCMGLGLYKKFSKTIENARDRLMMDLQRLRDSTLLLDSDGKEWFEMHDKFVDVAISISSNDWYALVGREGDGFKKWSEDELRKCTAMSFHRVGIEELPEKLDCPNLKILLLIEYDPFLKIPESFFGSMEKLQVLDITGLSFTSLPSSVELLENLKSLSLDQCHLEDVTVLGKLKGLQFLSLKNSTIARLPIEISGLVELRFLDLTGCTRLKVIEPGVLGSLVNLEELYMEDSFDQWEAEDEAPRSNASLAELKNMKKLITLCITIPHSTNLSSDLPFGSLNKHTILIGSTESLWRGYKESRTLVIKLDSSHLLHEVCMQICLGRTHNVYLDGLQYGSDTIHDLCTRGFLELKHLHVHNSPLFQYVVDSTHRSAFTRLESLVLENLNNLEKICHDCRAPHSFSILKIVKVENCGGIKHLFHSFMTRNFLQLEEIKIIKCQSMQQIVADVEADEYIDEIDDDANTKSFKLLRLTLRNLPQMTSFCKIGDHSITFLDGQQVSLPWLEYLTLSELPKLEEIWNSQFPSDVTNLKSLEVEDCAFLLTIFPSNLITKLWNLEVITIERCRSIREIFNLEGPIASRDVEISLRLTTLTLSDLPTLGHIWSKNPKIALCFRNLKALKVRNCENLRFLFSFSMAKTLQQIKEIEIASCKLLEEIIAVEEEESEEAASNDILEFPTLTSLSLEELPNLKTFACGACRIHCPTLTRLRISGCPKMMTFSSFEEKRQSMTTYTSLQQAFVGVSSSLPLPAFFDQNVLFPCLEALTLASCGLMKIWHNELSKESFCKLDSIKVQDCENLSHIFPSTLIKRFRSLKMIEVVKCTSLEALMEHVAVNSNQRQKCMLHYMESLTVEECPRLKNLFTMSEAKSLVQLQHLILGGCGEMEYIVAREEEKPVEATDRIVIPQLVTLYLHDMPKLRSFYQRKHISEWPSLKKFTVEDCKAVEVILGDASCRRLEGSVPTQQPLLLVEKVEFPNMELMKISHMDNVENIWLGELTSNAFTKLKTLEVEYCQKLSVIFSSHTNLTRFQNLERIIVTDCESLEVIFHVKEVNFSEARSTTTSTWPLLKQLLVRHCGKMRPFSFTREFQICHGTPTSENQPALISLEKVIPQLEGLSLRREDVAMLKQQQQHYTFAKLKELALSCYHDENDAFPSDFLLQRFPDLEFLDVVCSSFEEIFPECAFGHGGASVKVLGNLKRLDLYKLCNLRRVWKDGSLMAKILKQIEHLFVWQCPSLSILFPSPASFQRLKQLEVDDCAGLVHMGTCSAVTSLVHLTWLTLRNCGAMEDVVTDDGNGAKEISFPQLEELILDRLPSLESFSPANCVFKFPSLVRVVVTRCPKMNMFCKGALRTPILDKVLLSSGDDEWRWVGDLNTTIETLSA